MDDDRPIVSWLEELNPTRPEKSFLYIHLKSVHQSGLRLKKFQAQVPGIKGVEQTRESVYIQRYHDGILQADNSIRKIFTLLEKERIEKIIAEHKLNPHQRLVQNTLANEVTLMVHGKEDLENVKIASQVLFGQTTKDSLKNIDSETFIEIFESVPNASINIDSLEYWADTDIEVISSSKLNRGVPPLDLSMLLDRESA